MLMREPELNPSPPFHAPGLYFFLQTFATVAILLLPLVALRRSAGGKRDYAWCVLVLLLASPNTASYTFVLLLLPIALLLEEAALRERIFLVTLYLALTFAISGAWLQFFPKLWLLLILIAVTGASLLARTRLAACRGGGRDRPLCGNRVRCDPAA